MQYWHRKPTGCNSIKDKTTQDWITGMLCLLVSANLHSLYEIDISFAAMVSHAWLRVDLLVFLGTVGGRMAGT